MSASGRLVSRYPRRGGVQVSDVQRSRMLRSVVQIVSECGYGEMSVSRVTSGAGVSRRTFYELFENREECFLAAFDDAVAQMTRVAIQACEGETLWSERVRAALGVLLGFIDEQPALGGLVVVEALGAGPRVLKHRARLVAQLAEVVDQGRSQAGRRRESAPLAAEGIVGAVLAVVHTRLLEKPAAPLMRLLNPLMSMVLTPYLGDAVAARELQRPTPRKALRHTVDSRDPLHGLNMRITYRTLRVLTVIGENPGASNRQIADEAGVTDQGQISKLLARLQTLKLIHNTAPGQPTGEPNQWQLAPRGEEVQQAIHTQLNSGQQRNATRETH